MRSESARRARLTLDATPPLASAERGMALITVVMVMMLISALMVGFVSAIVADNRSSGLDHDQTQAYAAAHAGLEKLTSDLSGQFGGDVSPSGAQINALLVNQPTVPGFSYLEPDNTSGYKVTWDFVDANGNPAPESSTGSTITHGPYQGFKGLITPYHITVTARSNGGAEVRMRRTLQTIAVPVFQFGIFSETDLAFHAGETFTFGGRVHTNGNLFLSEGTGETLTIADRITAVGDVIRTHLPNGLAVTSGYDGVVRVPTTIMANPANNIYRNLLRSNGSLQGTVGSAVNAGWTDLSIGTYTSNIRSGHLRQMPDGTYQALLPTTAGTGAKRLDLPLVSQGARPIDLIRRPAQNSNENVPPALIYQQRYFGMAATSLRILLSDTAAEIMTLPTIDTTVQPVSLSVAGNGYTALGVAASRPPLARSGSPLANGALPASVYKSTDAPLINGFIKIEMQRQNQPGVWQDVTAEILSLGIAGRNLATNTPATALAARWNAPSNACPEINPNAVIRLQRVRDVPFNTTTANTAVMLNTACGYAAGVIPNVSQLATDYWPNALYDPREGNTRDGLATTDLALGGIMHYVELDMNNLRRWFQAAIPAAAPSGGNARNDNGNGFLVYFSDRRNNKNPSAVQCGAVVAPCETGEYGWEDIVNPTTVAGTPNGGAAETGEDLNGNGLLDTYGSVAQNLPTVAQLPVAPFDATGLVTTNLTMANKALIARANRTVHFRRALKIVNGTRGNIITPGLTIASENPVYVQGNFNATPADAWTAAHSAAAIIADSVTTLSNNWNDLRSFTAPTDSRLRVATSTAYRVAIVSGKGLAFPKPGFADASFGSDGGVHNFMRNLEDWATPNATHRYRGSLVSFFIDRQASGTFKCCQGDTYLRGPRDWTFDSDFLTPSLLPPGTPMFRDINTLTFRQLLRPNQ